MKKTLRPSRLSPGDRIGVVTPSWPVGMSPSSDPHGELDAGMEVLKEMGYRPFLGEHALLETGYSAGSPEDRARDINRMFEDESVKAIIASHGGHVASAVLPLLHWDAMVSNPKITLGFSNMSTLLLAIYARTGLITFHGPMVIWNLGQNPDRYEITEFRAMLGDGRLGPIRQREPWRTLRGESPGTGTLIGPAMGLRGLIGTPYEVPITGDVVLFFEGMVDAPGITESALRHLLYIGLFEHVRGVLVGSDGSAFTGSRPDIAFEEILFDVTSGFEFPVVKCDDFGHGGVNTVLPIGARVTLDPELSQLVIDEPYVRDPSG